MRFGSEGGIYVNQSELSLILKFVRYLPSQSRILDMPVGTGRVAHYLIRNNYTNIYGADYSQPMLEAAIKRCGTILKPSVQDAFNTDFEDAYFDVVISSRFVFHHELIEPLFKELHRIVRPDGTLIFDTLNWSPRTFLPALQRSLGGRVWCHSEAQIEALASKLDMTIVARERVLSLPSLLYCYVPKPVLPIVKSWDQFSPSKWRTKTIWMIRKH
jgi:SAM-dependent methyltransferase